MNWQAFFDPFVSGRFCMTLLHSLWQVGLLAMIVWIIDRLWSKQSVEWSYALHVAALVLGVAAVPVTYGVVRIPTPRTIGANDGTMATASATEPQMFPNPLVQTSPIVELEQEELGHDLPPAKKTYPVPETIAGKETSPLWLQITPWLAGMYASGVALMLIRLFVGIVQAHRLGSLAKPITEGPLVESLRSLSRRWSVRVVPALAQAEHLVVPKVVGLLRPTILLPASALTGLSISELEMILAHELAHVRRYDMWVNLLQRLAEVILFFNPALWYLSRRIGTLREYCCDELTCRETPESDREPRMRYAVALLRVVELTKSKPTNRRDIAALAASDPSPSELRRRVARLFGEPLPEPVQLSRGSVLTLGVAALVLVLAPISWKSNADSSPANSTELVSNTEGDETTRIEGSAGLDEDGTRIYSGDFEVVFPRPRKVTIRVVYGDTGKPASRVGVGALVTRAGFWETTDDDGMLQVPLADGTYKLGVFPRYGTPYLRTKSEVVVSAQSVKDPITLELRPAAVVEINVIDADTGKPLSDVDVWWDEPVTGTEDSHRTVRGYRSWEVETRISHYERPRSDENGKMRVLFEPGVHRIGVGLEAFPERYEVVHANGKEIDCQPGQPVKVEFRMRRVAVKAKEADSSERTSNNGKPIDLTIVVARHVLLLDGKDVITWARLDEKIAALPDPSLAHPHFYVTRGAREAGIDKFAKDEMWRLHRKFQLKGRSEGSLWPRSDFRYDRIKTEADLIPDESLRVDGRVLDRNRKPVTGAEVLLITPVDDSIGYKSYHVALVKGRIRNTLEHVMTLSDGDGRFALYPPKSSKHYIVAMHPDVGFALVRSDQFESGSHVNLLRWAGLISEFDEITNEQQSASLATRVRAENGWPEVIFNQYWSDLKEKVRARIFPYTHIPPIFETTVRRSFRNKQGDGSIGLPGASVGLLPGEVRRLDFGPLSEQQRAELERIRKDFQTRRGIRPSDADGSAASENGN